MDHPRSSDAANPDRERRSSDAAMRAALEGARVWAVVGLGDNPRRPAYGVASFLRSRGKVIIPVHPTDATALGIPVARSVTEAAEIAGHLDVVDCFVNSARVGAIADEAIAVGADFLWMQLGVIDPAAADRAEAAGLTVVMDRCPADEWYRVMGR